ncbi:Response regulator receiver domain protein [Poriferisphaera corsica]|uniref:Response regulator receiver domain protein n=1 Tax=Poriferisphaera corsica TaxID=2528020 RepID=A0A517YYK5_9BACT|nr:response regulator [Poriferisphaera corsica]QDU35309.1 Response regulator receiver domain protein [Poriferisphaera corsica]
MSHQAKTAKSRNKRLGEAKKAVSLLVVDPGDDVLKSVREYQDRRVELNVKHVKTLAEARGCVLGERFDMVMVEMSLPDGYGLDFVEELSQGKGDVYASVVGDEPNADEVIVGMRIGVCDFVKRPVDTGDVTRCLNGMVAKHLKHDDHVGRVDRLKRLCKKLNQARQDVSQQVDVLCNDLVMAYQELACQMQQVVQTSEYSALIREELDLENLLRTTLEHMIEKVGPTNAAIFLPSAMDEYSLGGYVNYDCAADSADMLLQHLADVVAPKVAAREDLLHVTDNETLKYWIGDDAAYLADSHVVAVACRHGGETLAVMVLFRDCNEPFEDGGVEMSGAVGPLLAEALSRVIRVHHRFTPEVEDWGGEDDDQEDWGIDFGFGEIEGEDD